jgi:hypothetical protein
MSLLRTLNQCYFETQTLIPEHLRSHSACERSWHVLLTVEVEQCEHRLVSFSMRNPCFASHFAVQYGVQPICTYVDVRCLLFG